MKKYSLLIATAVAASLGLAACQKTEKTTETVIQPVAVPTPAPAPAPSSTVVTVPTPVPGPPGPAGSPGAPGAEGAPGKSGSTVVIVPPAEEKKN